MPETIYSSDPSDPNRIDVKEYDHPDGERGAIHYYQQQPDAAPKHISGDEFAEYMHPGLLEARKKDIEDHADEAKEWVRLQRENKLINDEGRRVSEEGKLLFPNRKEKVRDAAGDLTSKSVEGAKKGVEALAKISVETKNTILEALVANEIERARQLLKDSGINPEDLSPNDGNTLITPKIEGEAEADTVVKKPENKGGKPTSEVENGFAQKSPEAVLRLQEEVKKKYKQAESELTSFDLSIDPSIKRNIEEQIRGKVTAEYINGLPEGEQEEAKKNKKEILEALKIDPNKIEAIREKDKVVYANGEDEVGRYKLRFTGGVLEINRNVDANWNIVGDSDKTGWFELANGEIVKGWINGAPAPEDKKSDEGVDVEVMEGSMKKVEELNNELKTAIENSDLEKAKEIQGQIDEEMKKMRSTWEAAESTDEEVKEISPEEAKTIITQRKENRWKRAARRFKEWVRHPIHGTNAILMSRVSGGEESSGGETAPGEGAPRKVTVVEEETAERSEKDRRTLAGFAAGGLAVAAGGVLTYFLMRQGHPTEVIQQFIQGKNNFVNNGHDMFVQMAGHGDHLQHLNHIDFESLKPSTIHATSPDQFHKGVLSLLSHQGVNVHAATPEKLHHMTEWMQTHEQIASGMKEGEHHLVQNLTNFPDAGQHFANANASANQGFQIGADGSGKAALIEYAKEAQRIGLIG